jgi:hypothetical protein
MNRLCYGLIANWYSIRENKLLLFLPIEKYKRLNLIGGKQEHLLVKKLFSDLSALEKG